MSEWYPVGIEGINQAAVIEVVDPTDKSTNNMQKGTMHVTIDGGITLEGDATVSIDGVATEDKQDDQITLLNGIKTGTDKIIAAPATAAAQSTEIAALASILAKILAAPATEAKQDTQITSLASILAKIIAAPATEAKQDTQITSLASILAKIIAAPATEAKQDTQITSLASILAKIIVAPATEAKQDTQITSLASILAKIIAAPATEAKQDTQITSLASILAKIIAAPATEAKQDTQITALAAILTGTILAAGENHIGKVGGEMVQVTQTFTREANTTAYTSGDVVSAAAANVVPTIVLSNVVRANGGSGYITGFRLIMNDKGKVPTWRVHLYSVNTPTIAGDNLAMKELYADVGKKIGSFDLAAMISPADTAASDNLSRTHDMTLRLPFVCDAASRSLYVVLEATLGFTPVSASQFTLIANIDQN